MVTGSRSVKLIISEKAWLDLRDIWLFNAERYGGEHAAKYQEFLFSEMASLCVYPNKGARVPRVSAMRFLIMKRRSGGHGHAAYYEIHCGSVYVIRVLHTAMHAPDHISGV